MTINNSSPKERWLMVYIYVDMRQRGKYSTLAADTEGNSSFKYILKWWDNISQKDDLIRLFLHRLQYFRKKIPFCYITIFYERQSVIKTCTFFYWSVIHLYCKEQFILSQMNYFSSNLQPSISFCNHASSH